MYTQMYKYNVFSFFPRDAAVCAMSRSQRSEPTPEPGGRQEL